MKFSYKWRICLGSDPYVPQIPFSIWRIGYAIDIVTNASVTPSTGRHRGDCIYSSEIVTDILEACEFRWHVCGTTGSVAVRSYLKVAWLIAGYNPERWRTSIWKSTGPCLNIKTVFPGYRILIINPGRPWDRLIFKMGTLIPVRRHLYIEMAPRLF